MTQNKGSYWFWKFYQFPSKRDKYDWLDVVLSSHHHALEVFSGFLPRTYKPFHILGPLVFLYNIGMGISYWSNSSFSLWIWSLFKFHLNIFMNNYPQRNSIDIGINCSKSFTMNLLFIQNLQRRVLTCREHDTLQTHYQLWSTFRISVL